MRLIIVGLSILALLVVGALVGPSFVDWDKYKPQIIAQVQKATGLNVQINGDMSLSILPVPHVKIEGLVVEAPKKVKFENLLTMKSAEVSVAIAPLLSKKIEVSSVTLNAPDIQIEILADGTPSWETTKLADNETPQEAGAEVEAEIESTPKSQSAMDSISLDKIEINDGKVAFINHQTGAQYSVSDANVVLTADSLKGPFDVDGSLVYNNNKINIDAETGKLPTADEGLKINAVMALPDADARVSFDGVTSIKAPFDVQGQTSIKASSPAKLAQAFGSNVSGALNQSLSFEGLVTANETQAALNDFKMTFGDFTGNGKLSIQNLKSKNPLVVNGAIKSASTLNLDSFMKKSSKPAGKNETDALKNAGKGNAKSSGLVPQSLTLPMPINADIQLDIAGLKLQGKDIKGVSVDLKKQSKTSTATFKVLELPGQAKANGTLNVAYASSSTSPKTRQVTYADPTVSYKVNGQAGQLKTFLSAFAPEADISKITNLYKSAQFNLNGAVSGNAISLKDSTLKLDDLVVGLGGRYEPAINGQRAKAIIDVSAGTINFDQILGKKPATKSDKAASSNSGSANPEKALEPVKNISLPLDVVFDVSLQKAIYNGDTLEGVRLTGDLIGQKLNLKNASVNNFAGASASVKGQVGNLSNLSGLDVTLYTKTADVGRLAKALNVDLSKAPAGLKSLEANVTGKGKIEALNFNANVKALGGQVDASGNANNILKTPEFDNLTVRLKHPNLVQAIQIVSPGFKGQAGLQQAIDFYAKVNSSGKAYSLSDMKVALGQTNFGGNLKIDTGAKPLSVRGDIKAGKIALDSLLGAKKSSGGSASSSGSSSSSKPSSGGRWSKTPIDLGWMNTVDVDVDLAASSITYGAWNFTNPATDLKIGNGQMRINGLKAGVFGGTANLSTEVKASPVSLNVSADMNGIDLESLVKSLSGSSKLKSSGTVSFDTSVNSTGNSAFALINALNGKANLNGTDVTLKGFDLAKLARGLATEEKLITSATSLINGAMSGGQTKFDTVKGDYVISNGVVKITSMAFDSADVVINSSGTADLPKWYVNVDNVITLKNVTDLDPFEVKIKGPIDNPTDTFGKNILEDYITAKIKRKAVKELGDKLPDVLGKDATNALQKFGILPQKEAPKAAPETPTGQAPANDNTATEPAPAVEPTPAPKKIEKPEDALKELLNSENPEDAVGNVLKGLF